MVESHMLLENRQPFPAAVTWFDHQPILLRTTFKRHIFARKEVKEVWIEPVAFRPNHDKLAPLKKGSAPLGMEACLARHPSGRLMRRSSEGWVFIDDDGLTDDELRRLKIGVQGDEELLMEEFNSAIEGSLGAAIYTLEATPDPWPFKY